MHTNLTAFGKSKIQFAPRPWLEYFTVLMSSSIARPFWKTYELGLVPGPTRVPEEINAAYSVDFGSTDLEAVFFDYYAHMQTKVQKLLNTNQDVVFMTGEAMVALWGALKSVLQNGDRVLSIGCGKFLILAAS